LSAARTSGFKLTLAECPFEPGDELAAEHAARLVAGVAAITFVGDRHADNLADSHRIAGGRSGRVGYGKMQVFAFLDKVLHLLFSFKN